MNSREVKISKTAEKKLEQLFSYFTENWPLKVKQNFIEKLDKSIEFIKVYPESCQESSKKRNLRKCIVTKHTSLYYRFNETQIILVTIFDNRQNPEKLEKELVSKD